MSNQTYDFSSILENAWNATWTSDSPAGGYGDNRPKDMNNPSASRKFLFKLGLISANPDALGVHKTLSYGRRAEELNQPIEKFGLSDVSSVDRIRNRSLYGQDQSHDSLDVTSRDDQVTLSLRRLSLSERNTSDSSNSSVTFLSTLQDKFRIALIAVQKGHWDIVLEAIQTNPELLRSSATGGRTLLHIALSQNQFVPEKVITMMLHVCPRIIYAVDANCCTSLHYAASHGSHSDLVPILLEHWKDGASQANIDGNLPLHVAALGGQRTELNALVLMGVFPQAAGFMNHKGMLPLHMACSQKDSSHVTVFKLLEIHHIMNLPIDLRDQEGQTPLQRAMKSSAPKEVLTAFNVYHNDTRHFPRITDVKSECQSHSENRTCAEPDSIDLLQPMPEIKDAAEDALLTAINGKMPIRLGLVYIDGFSKIMYQGSTRFWWSVATDTSGEYFDLVEKILSKFTTFSEVIALAKVTGPDGERTVFDVAHPLVVKMISDNLYLCESYELHLRLPEKSHGLLIYKAALHDLGDRPSKTANTSSTVADGEACTKGVLIHCTRMNSDRDKEMLREIEMRQKLHMEKEIFQSVINHHVLSGRRFGCPNEQVRLVVFERHYLTLANVLEKHRFRKRRNNGWLRKCRNVLKQVARILQCLHDSNYVHGMLAPELIAKFGDNDWKLMRTSGVKHLGDNMDGELRSCIPPESIMEFVLPEILSPRPKSISFKDDICNNGIKLSCHDQVHHLNLAFVPEKCPACTSWDAWGFGLVMGQMLLGSSAINLPNFDRDSTMHLKRLFDFKYETLEVIKVSMAKYAGDHAADLVGRLLEPSPHKRLKNMKDILCHSYFTEEVGHFTI